MSRRLLVPLGMTLLLACGPGCRLAGTSLSANSDTRLPSLGLTFTPKQSEPDVSPTEPATAATPIDDSETSASNGALLTRWLKPGGKSAKSAKPKRITIPRTDLDDENAAEPADDVAADETDEFADSKKRRR